jgi:hypothetical protein
MDGQEQRNCREAYHIPSALYASIRRMAKKNPHAVALGRKGGSVTSEKKARSSRRNILRALAKKRLLEAQEKA